VGGQVLDHALGGVGGDRSSQIGRDKSDPLFELLCPDRLLPTILG
jgi:hypothetical protein